jgi:hypothetical protein
VLLAPGAGAILTIVDPDDEDDEGNPDVCEGNSIPWAPEWTAFAILNASFQYGHRIHVPITTNPRVRFTIDGRPHRSSKAGIHELILRRHG